MKCKLPSCEVDVSGLGTGKRPREYCSNAHKQADYRRRHKVQPEAEAVVTLRRELDEARQRIAELEKWVDLSALTPPLSGPVVESVSVRGGSPEQSTGAFDLADFTQPLQHEYRSSATRDDVRAWLTLRPEPQGIQGDYRIDYFSAGRADGKKSMGKDQQTRGEQLKTDLKAEVLKVLFMAGWQAGPHGIYVCPKPS